MRELLAKNLERYKKLAPEFKTIFGISLMPRFWNHLTGFDIIKFDEWLQTPDGVSMRDAVLRKYGEKGVDLTLKLIGNASEAAKATPDSSA